MTKKSSRLTQAEATTLYLKHQPRSRRIIHNLTKHRKGMTGSQFANTTGLSLARAYTLLRDYGLINTIDNGRIAKMEATRKKWASKWNTRKTITENAIAMGINYDLAIKLRNNYNFEYKTGHRLTKQRLNSYKKITRLNSLGLNDAEIGRLIGCTRERVRQRRVEMRSLDIPKLLKLN